MPRPERLRGLCAFVGVALLICATLAGRGAQASVLAVPEARLATAATMAVPGIPTVSDGMPCALCYVAPTPGPHAFTGEGKETEPLTWCVHADPIPAAVQFLTAASCHDRVPIRVAFCRWLD